MANSRVRRAFLAGLTAVLVASSPLLTGHYTVPWDATASWLLALRWMGSALRQGHFAEYFPHVFSGYTIAAQPELGCYNVLYLLVAVLFPDSVLAINALALVLQCLQFAFCFRLGRQLGMGPLGCLCLSLSVVASGFWVGHAEHFSFQVSALSATMLLSGLLDLSAGRARSGCALIACGGYMLGTAGYPALMLSIPLVMGAIALNEWRHATRRIRFVGLGLLAAAGGALAASPAIVHFVSALSRNYRGQGVDVATVMRGSLPLYSMANLFWPGWRWTVSATDISMDRLHLLWLTPWAAGALAWMLWRRSHRLPDALAARLPFWTALALILLVLSLGRNFPIPLRALLAEHALPFRMGRWPGAEYIFFVQLVLAVAGAAGLEAIASRRRLRTGLVAAVVIVDFLAVMFATRGLRFHRTPSNLSGTLPRFKVVYGPDDKALRRPRLCDDASEWMVDQTRLAPARFDWWGYMSLVPDAYVRDKEAMKWAICGGPRLWDADARQPIQYTLLAYMPSRVSIRFAAPPAGTRLLWAETVDPYWRLRVAGRPVAFENGPAALRYFRVPPGLAGDVQAEMAYLGPLSRLWRPAE